MEKPRIPTGALVGLLLTAPLVALFFLGDAVAGLPLVPFDVFDWVARILPGPVVTFGIDLMVDTLIALDFSVASVAKTAEHILAVVGQLAGGAVAGAAFFGVLRRMKRTYGFAPGLALGVIVGLPVLLISLAVNRTATAGGTVGGLWIAAAHLAWGTTIGWVYDNLAARPPRTAKVEVRFGCVVVPAPRDCGKFVRQCGIVTITMGVVEVREIRPPAGVKPLRWVLLTSLAVGSFDDAWQVIGYYEKRPLIEEFHKALKTGCRLESRQYRKSHRLEAVTGMLSVLAVRLLQLKSVARVDPQRPAEAVVPKRWLTMMRCLQRGRHRKLSTVREFYHAIAKLGGWLGRKHDGEPGWITLWRGFDKFILIMRGADANRSKCG